MNSKDVVPLSEAIDQVEIAMIRLAFMHLSFSKTLVKELGEEKGKELIIRSIIEYGRMISDRTKEGHPDLSNYGIHGKYVYEGKEYIDVRDLLKQAINEELDFSKLEIHDCILSHVFKEQDEEDLGKLYCYVDAAKSMATDPKQKAIHSKCTLCGDDFCQIVSVKTTKQEQKDFENSNADWKNVDPILLK
ncbi:MAG: L-2-amino-thiazoline-4-carboxylic acid hydrolase [Candidatus Heimdallarchaeota archaeon]|nr:L-2-amino-thiazoline-4-carboxylic acid hydrolase [Candidatus Heimdallarchaeota archaeon]MCK4955028.1 L-2-amino-thiazoline-4-carboxylic acid hydrolase [Candidatus Heimdallarchaeota archaeon]